MIRLTKTSSFVLTVSISILSCRVAADKVVAHVDGDSITAGEVVQVMSGGGYSHSLDGVKEALNSLVEFHLLLQAAKAKGEIDWEKLSQKMEEINNQSAVRKLYNEEVVKGARATDEEVKEYYETKNVGEEVSARHILIKVNPNASQKEKQSAHNKAMMVLQKAIAGDDFANLAMNYSDDTTAPFGGELGFFAHGSMERNFEDTAFNLGEGEISNVVETRYGYHIIKVDKKRRKSLLEMEGAIRSIIEQPRIEDAGREFLEEIERKSGTRYVDEALNDVLRFIHDSSARDKAFDEKIIVTYRDGNLTAGDFLSHYENLPTEQRRSLENINQLKRFIGAGILRNQLLFNEAKRKGYDKDSEVVKESEDYRDNVIVQNYITDRIMAGIDLSDERLRNYYDEHTDLYGDKEFSFVKNTIRQQLINEQLAASDKDEILARILEPMKNRKQIVIMEDDLNIVLEILNDRIGDD